MKVWIIDSFWSKGHLDVFTDFNADQIFEETIKITFGKKKDMKYEIKSTELFKRAEVKYKNNDNEITYETVTARCFGVREQGISLFA